VSLSLIEIRRAAKEALEEGISLKSLGQLEAVEGDVPSWLVNQYLGWNFNPGGVAYDSLGGLYLTDQNNPHLYYMSPDRQRLTLIKNDLPANGGQLDYNHVKDTVLWAQDGYVKEIDKDGNVKNSLSTGQGGQAGHWSGEGKFVLANPSEHYAFEMDWDGNELWSFGEYGTSGNDLSHLNSPKDVCIQGPNNYAVADTYNHRIMRDDDGDGTAEHVTIVPLVRNVEPVRPTSQVLVSTYFPQRTMWWVLLLESLAGDNKVRGALPGHSNDLAVHPTEPLVALLQCAAFEETSLRAFKYKGREPQEVKPLDSRSIDAGDTFTSDPILVWPYGRISIYTYGDQSHDLTIERVRTHHNLEITGNVPATYDDLDTMSVSADTLKGWHTEVPLTVIRVRVKNTGDDSGSFSVWVSGRER